MSKEYDAFNYTHAYNNVGERLYARDVYPSAKEKNPDFTICVEQSKDGSGYLVTLIDYSGKSIRVDIENRKND